MAAPPDDETGKSRGTLRLYLYCTVNRTLVDAGIF